MPSLDSPNLFYRGTVLYVKIVVGSLVVTAVVWELQLI